MPRFMYPEKLRLSSPAGQDAGYRPPTPYPTFERHSAESSSHERLSTNSRSTRRSPRFYSYVDVTRYKYDDDIRRKVNEQNAKIERRPRDTYGRQFDSQREAPKRVRFTVPARRRDMDEADALAWEFAKLSYRGREPRSLKGRCSRCGQRL